MTKPLNLFQNELAKAYSAGDHAWIIEQPDWRAALHDCGDSLFIFLMSQLSDQQDCENLETALQRLKSAADDIKEVYDAIEALQETEPKPADQEPEASDEKRIIATFVPQVWVNDHAVTCDPLGETRFDVTDAILAMGQADALQLRDDDMGTDNLAQLPNAPDWIKNWPGPFYVAVEAAIAAYFGTLTNPDGEPNRQAA